ncbi:MAG: DUF5011 domain-containing protein [Bacteroidales bacterium]|nr:DUF5011 domain-containing protein [Bacteroidales bacterium]
MKKYIFIVLAAAFALMAVSCEKESEGVTRITYYPTIELKGDNPVKIAKGGTYSDPGFIAEMNGEDVSDQVTVDASAVDMSAPGIYSVYYSIVNADGISASSVRKVFVIDPAGGIANVYYGRSRNASGSRDYKGCPTVISATTTPNVYFVDDLLAGYYYYGIYPGYEPTYDFHWEGYIKIDTATNAVSLASCGEWYFYEAGDTVSGMYYPADGSFAWICYGSVRVDLTPVKLDD